jgi:hypothetical protein
MVDELSVLEKRYSPSEQDRNRSVCVNAKVQDFIPTFYDLSGSKNGTTDTGSAHQKKR